jgi:hypothetical protein
MIKVACSKKASKVLNWRHFVLILGKYKRMRQVLAKWMGDNIRTTAVLISLALSAWMTAMDGVVNRDGILYLDTARIFGQEGLPAALDSYSWPFYSILISVLSQLSGLSIEASAHLVSALLYGLMVFVFISIVKELGGDRRVLIAAALVILIHPQLNSYRSEIFRDHGYWAFYLSALWFFIKYYRVPHFRYVIGWTAAILAATLFRIEGVVILFLLPLAILFKPDTALLKRLAEWSMANIAWLGGLLLAAGWLLISSDNNLPSTKLRGLLGWLQFVQQDLMSSLHEKAGQLNAAVLNKYSANHAFSATLAVLAAIFISESLGTLGLVYLLVLVHSLLAGAWSRMARHARRILAWVISLNVLILGLFLAGAFFLTGRYVMPLLLILMLVIPFHLVYLVDRFSGATAGPLRRRMIIALTSLVVIAVIIDGLYSFGASKQHLKDAGLWVGERIAVEGRFYSNEGVPLYYARTLKKIAPEQGDWQQTLQYFENGTWDIHDYLAIRVKDQQAVNDLNASLPGGLRPVQEFKNERGDKILIFHNKE